LRPLVARFFTVTVAFLAALPIRIQARCGSE
jgi:hypothetical protein